MQYSNKLTLAIACLAGIALAKPIDVRSTNSQLEARQYRECPKGSFYIKCWNDPKIEGCFTKYPCDETSDRASETACPELEEEVEEDDNVDDMEEEETAVVACTPGRALVPDLYTLKPEDKDAASDAQTRIEIRKQDGEASLEQVAHFKLPAGATSCSLGWMMNVADKRTFRVDDSGLLKIVQFSELPEGDVSWNAVEPLVEAANGTVKHGDMTFWDQPEYNTARNHSIGSVDCSVDVLIKIQLETSDGQQGHVIMEQDQTNGFFVDYKC